MTEHLYPEHPILLVDDEQPAINSLTQLLFAEGINNTLACSDSRDVAPLIAGRDMEMVLLDLTMPNITGEELLELLGVEAPDVPVIVITGIQEIDTAIRCLKLGAFDYIIKPAERGRLTASIRHALEQRRLRRENSLLKKRIYPGALEQPEAFSRIITTDPTMHAVFQYCEAIAPSGLPVLITGETGVGKELVAQALHALSRIAGDFVPVNISGLDDTVFSDTLFGHRKGAFTGAAEARQGLIVRADGGTLFLDEIGDLSAASQIKLLRLLQEHEYFPLGSDMPKEAKVRVVAATNHEVKSLQSRKGSFRRDLFYRLCTHHIHIPPLRERLGDVPVLCEYFLEKAARELNKKIPDSCAALTAALSGYDFPGNVRELRALVYNAVSSGEYTLPGLPKAKTSAAARPEPLAGSRCLLFTGTLPTLDHACELLISEALRRCGGNQTVAAKMIGISRQTLIRYVKKDRSA